LARRQQGATQAEIAREYGVSQGTVSQILKRAREEWQSGAAASASESEPANDDAGAPASVAAAGSGSETAGTRPTLTVSADAGRTQPETAADSQTDGAADGRARESVAGGAAVAAASAPAEPVRAESPATTSAYGPAARPREPGQRRVLTTARSVPESRPETAAASGSAPDTAPTESASAGTGAGSPPAESGGASLQETGNPLADRLRRAADHAAKLVDADTGAGDQLGQAVHEVRRALAAIEIDAAKRQSVVTRASAPEPEIDDNEQFGRIKFFKPEKGFGFIIPDDGGDDIFLSSKTVSAAGLDNLTQGDRVRFVPGPGSKGLEAKSIERDD
jgi:CspA family cold shock protein